MKHSFNESKCAKAHCDPRLVAKSQAQLRTVYRLHSIQKVWAASLLNGIAKYDDIAKKCDESVVQATKHGLTPQGGELDSSRGEFSVTF